MQRLFSYIIRYNFIFLFLILEVFAFILVIQNNYQRATFLNASNGFVGSILNTSNNISEYFSLKTTNEQLAEENRLLRQQLESSFVNTDSNLFYSKDSMFTYVSVKIIKNSVNRQKNYLTLNKGSKHGIHEDMGVISSNGVIGTVVEVSENFARVMSVLHIQNKVNARIKKNRHLGNIEWNGKNYKKGILTDIPGHVQLNHGDTVITSGNSLLFPEGIILGTVDEFANQAHNNFNIATIDFAVDYNNLQHAFVIVNLLKEELEIIGEETE